MYTLNESFFKSFNPNLKCKIKSDFDDIFIIENFFESPELVLSFQEKLDKWDTNSFGTLKPGIEVYLPPWVPNPLLKNLNRKLNLTPNYYDYSCQVNFNYFFNSESLEKSNDFRTKGILPHTDEFFEVNSKNKTYIFLLNLNKSPVVTNFWEYFEKKYEESQEQRLDYDEYVKKFNINNTQNEKNLKVYYECEYNFNTAILYPANMYHSPYIDKKYTSEFPRIMFRIQYVAQKKPNLDYR